MEVVVFNEKIYHFSTTLETTLADVIYSCGALLDELNLPPGLESVCIRDHQCGDTTEKLYYFAGFDPVCYYCDNKLQDITLIIRIKGMFYLVEFSTSGWYGFADELYSCKWQ